MMTSAVNSMAVGGTPGLLSPTSNTPIVPAHCFADWAEAGTAGDGPPVRVRRIPAGAVQVDVAHTFAWGVAQRFADNTDGEDAPGVDVDVEARLGAPDVGAGTGAGAGSGASAAYEVGAAKPNPDIEFRPSKTSSRGPGASLIDGDTFIDKGEGRTVFAI